MSELSTPVEDSQLRATGSRRAAYIELTKLRISVMVLVTFVTAGVLSAAAVGQPIEPWTLLFAVIGMLGVSASGNAMNMFVERYSDFFMDRTKGRPLPAQRLTANEVALFGAISFGVGISVLLAAVNWQTALCGAATWILYVLIYTPLKRITWLNTEVGAVAGALPVIMGCLALSGTVPTVGWAMFVVLLVWQFPHFMAIAWMYRDDYARGDLQMLTVVDPTGKRAGRKAIAMSIVLTLVSLWPVVTLEGALRTWSVVGLSLLLGFWYTRASIRFANSLSLPSAKRLLKVSVIYLPLYMLLLVVACLT